MRQIIVRVCIFGIGLMMGYKAALMEKTEEQTELESEDHKD